MTEKELKELLHSMSLQEKLGEMTQMATFSARRIRSI